MEKVFDNKAQAEAALKTERVWAKQYKSKSGDRQMYRCIKVKSRAEKQCVARVYLLYSSKDETVQLFRSTTDHDHVENVDQVTCLSDEVKNEIRTISQIEPRSGNSI